MKKQKKEKQQSWGLMIFGFIYKVMILSLIMILYIIFSPLRNIKNVVNF